MIVFLFSVNKTFAGTIKSSMASTASYQPNELVPTSYVWLQSVELGYEQKSESLTEEQSLNRNSCWYCGNSSSQLSTCSNCHVAKYCSRDCQVADWKRAKDGGIGHKHTCPGMCVYRFLI